LTCAMGCVRGGPQGGLSATLNIATQLAEGTIG
jgi:hypothetical protein